MAVINKIMKTFNVPSGDDTIRYEICDDSGRKALETKAQVDGYYEELAAGTADQLASTQFVEESEPYVFRTSGGTADIGNRETDMLIGGTIAWNQHVGTNGNWGVSDNGKGTRQEDGTVKVTVVGSSTYYGCAIASSYIRANHVYFVYFKVKEFGGNVNQAALKLNGVASDSSNSLTEPGDRAYIVKPGSGYIVWQAVIRNSSQTTLTPDTDYATFSGYMVIDLTQMFGSTIADYLYALETATPGSGISWFRKLFPKSYYAYNAGELISVQASKHITTGFNQWDEQWELGTYSSVGGAAPYNTNIRSKTNKPIKVLPNTTYYISCSNTSVKREVFYYDEKVSFISYVVVNGNGTFTTPENCRYLKFCFYAGYGTTYKHDICINISWTGYRNGEYEPYEAHSYALDSDLSLRGLLKLDADNELYYDGDEYRYDGSVKRKYGIVNMGNLTWEDNGTTSTGYYQYRADVTGKAYGFSNMIAEKFETVSAYADNKKLLTIVGRDNSNMVVCCSSETSANAFKTSVTGQYLVYELATPTTESADPFNRNQFVCDFGTEEYVDALVEAGTRDVSMPVGHLTQYQANLRDKLQHLPSLAEQDGNFLIEQTNNQMRLKPYDLNHIYAKSAEQLVTQKGETDKVPYNFRQVGGSISAGDRLNDTVVGGTIAWNQLCTPVTSGTYNNLTITANADGSITFSGTPNDTSVSLGNFKITSGHKYIYRRKSVSGVWSTAYGTYFQTSSDYDNYRIIEANSSGNISFGLRFVNTTTEVSGTATLQIFDITQMFGATIADYITSLETATDGAGVSWFRNLFPKAYYAYDTGSLQSVQAAGHVLSGFNQWDGEWEAGYINTANGQNKGTSYTRTKNYVRVVPNTLYCALKGTRTFYYDYDKNYIDFENVTKVGDSAPFTTPANCWYIRFCTTSASGTVEGNCISLSDPERNGTYVPYEEPRVYPLDSSLTLRGIPKLDTNNKLCYDGDIYEADGTVTRRYGVVDLGTLAWGYNSGNCNEMNATVSDIKGAGYLLCTKYPYVQIDGSGTITGNDKIITHNKSAGGSQVSGYWPAARLLVKDTAYTDAAAFKAAMSGVYLIYELATPTSETASPYEPTQICDPYGTEEYTEWGTRDVAIPVGHSTLYQTDLRDKLEHLPKPAESDGTYIIEQTDKQLRLKAYEPENPEDFIALSNDVEDVKAALTLISTLYDHLVYKDTEGSTYLNQLRMILRGIDSVSANFNQGNNTIYDNASLDDLKQYLTVTVTYKDSTTATVSDYTLSGTLTAGTSTITVNCAGRTMTFDVTVVVLTSISSSFNQGGNVISNEASLNDLKQYLTVTAHHNDSSSETVTDYTLSGTLTIGTSTITVTYGGKTTTFDVTVSSVLKSITASFNLGNDAIYVNDSLDDLKQYLTVTASYSDSSQVSVSTYTLSGTLTAGSSTITVSYEEMTTTFSVTVSEEIANLSSLSATYTQGYRVIYTTDTLNILRDALVVTGTYSDSSTETVTAYSLRGSLTAGTSTITACYGGQKTTFNVTVTAMNGDPNSITQANANLPEGYTQLKFIENVCDGLQEKRTISTGVAEADGYRAEYGVVVTEHPFGAKQHHMVSAYNVAFPYFRYNRSNVKIVHGNNCGNELPSELQPYEWNLHTVYTIAGYPDFIINGTKYTELARGTATSNSRFYIFGSAYSSGGAYTLDDQKNSTMRVYYLRMYDSNDQLLRNFIPCKNSNGVVGLYDLVTEQFYSNYNANYNLTGGEAIA